VGEIKVKDESGKDTLYATSGGFVEAKENNVIVLAETAESAAEIDVQRAKAAGERASQRLRGHDPGIDIDRAHLAMLRSLNRLKVASKA
jgi:F-type H+-transporting ATPase subunit epsilon